MKNNLRILAAITLISILYTALSFSQTDEPQDPGRTSSLQIGFLNETALYYHTGIGPHLTLKSGISAVWNYDEKMDGEGTYQYQNIPSPMREEQLRASGINTNYDIVVSSILMYNLNDYEYAQVSLGFGPSLSYALNKNLSKNSNFTDTTYYRSSSESRFSVVGIGPSITASIRSTLYGKVSIISEYGFSAYYTWNSDHSDYRTESKYSGSSSNAYTSGTHQESHGWKLKLSNVRVGLLIAL